MKEQLAVYEDCYVPLLLLENENTNVGFRIAYLLQLLSGNNQLSDLEYYLEHVVERSDGRPQLHGAYGPRIRFWVGSDQLAEANRVNSNIDDERKLVKPQGIDQLRMVCEDIGKNGLQSSSFIVRDPAVDFEVSNDIPNLLTGTFYTKGNKINLFLSYEYIDESVVNDLWLFSRVLQICSSWMYKEIGQITVVTVTGELDQAFEDYIVNCDEIVTVQQEEFTPSPMDFWDDINYLIYLEENIRNMFNEGTFGKEEISYEEMIRMMLKVLRGNIKTVAVRDIGYALLIWVLVVKFDCYAEGYIIEMLREMSTSLKEEVAYMIIQNPVKLDVLEAAKEIRG